jgi:hypothetical protein
LGFCGVGAVRNSFVKFRGEDIEVRWKVVEDDPTTNAYEIEFEFYVEPIPEATGDECDSITDQLAMLDDGGYDDYFD